MRGQVVGYPEGEGLPGIEVLVRDPQGASAVAVSDADGVFVVPSVDAGPIRVQARAPGTTNRIGAYLGDVSSFCGATVLTLDEGGVLEGLRIELPVGGVIAGVVSDVDGAPTAASVVAQGVGALESNVLRRGEAGADGAYAVLGLSSWVDGAGTALPGAYRLSAALPGEPAFFAPGTWDIEAAALVPAVRGSITPFDLGRPPGASARGRLVSSAGAPLQGVEVAGYAQGFGVVGTTVTASDGTFLLGDLPGAGLLFRVRGSGWAETWWPRGAGSAEGEAFAGGVAIELGDTQPLPAASLRLLVDLDGAPWSGAVQVGLLRADGGLRRALVGDAQAGAAAFGDLPEGDWQIEVRAAGTGEVLAPVVLIAGGLTTAAISLQSNAELTGLVAVRAGGRPLRGAWLEALDPDTVSVITAAQTDRDGRARLRLPPDLAVLLRASWEPFCPLDPAFVPQFGGEARLASDSTPVLPGSAPVSFALAPDADRDGMDDVWELLWGLDPGRADGGEDPDGDGLLNLAEYQGHTDPLGVDGLPSGCMVASVRGPGPGLALAMLLLGVAVVPARRGRYHARPSPSVGDVPPPPAAPAPEP